MDATPIITPLDAPMVAPPTIEVSNINTVDKMVLIDIPNRDISPIPIMLKVSSKLIDIASSVRTDILLLTLAIKPIP